MKITIYELLKLIKENKAPKEIEYDGYLLSWDNVDKDYYCEEYGNLLEYLFGEYQTTRVLDITVKILEEKKIPEKLEGINSLFKIEQDLDLKGFLAWQKANNKMIENKINSIIDYLESKGE